jgi:hypothetical protein
VEDDAADSAKHRTWALPAAAVSDPDASLEEV